MGFSVRELDAGNTGRQPFTWSGDSANFGGGPTWLTGSYDVETDTLYWTMGNPAPDFDGTVREGDNLYTCSVLALDPDTGRLKWHFQHTPHDTHDGTPIKLPSCWMPSSKADPVNC